jgi:hypothetical protein
MRHVYHHFGDPVAMNASVARSLKPGGRLVPRLAATRVEGIISGWRFPEYYPSNPMSPVGRDLIVGVLLSSVAAAVADVRPPTLEATTAFIAAAVQRHHAPIPLRDEQERGWTILAEFSGCSIERRTLHEVRLLSTWETRTSVARWRLVDTDPAAIRVTTETHGGKPFFLVTLPCDDDRACVDRGPLGRDRVSYFEFASEQMAQRVAAGFRHATNLCQNSL